MKLPALVIAEALSSLGGWHLSADDPAHVYGFPRQFDGHGLPVGHVPVLDGHDGVLRVPAREIVDQHLTVLAKLRRQRLSQPLIKIQVHSLSFLHRGGSTVPIRL